VRALAVLLALPAACQNQPQPGANVLPPARAAEAPPPRTDLQTAEDAVRRQLNDPPGLSFANGAVWRDGRRERYIVVAGRAAWVESEMRPGEMARAVSEFCRTGARRPQGRAS